ncbi:porin family protein [Myxococcota bacterium]|nr:porin family protein [Myxococcota bacterium]
MNLRTPSTLALFAVAMLASANAHAEGWLAGVDLRLLPAGTIEMGGDEVTSSSVGTAPTFGVTGHVDYAISRYFLVGVMPQVLFGIVTEADAGEPDQSALSQLDLMLRLTGGFDATQALKIYGYVAPGYSILFMYDDWGYDDPAGFVLAVGAGASYDVGRRMYLSLDLGYQAGFQSLEDAGRTAEVTTSFLTLGLGLGFRL